MLTAKMRRVAVWLLVPMMLLLGSCSILTPQQRDTARLTVEEEYAAGNITLAQRDAIIEALDNDEPVDWGTLGIVGLSIISGLVGGPAIVRRQRGPPTKSVKAVKA